MFTRCMLSPKLIAAPLSLSLILLCTGCDGDEPSAAASDAAVASPEGGDNAAASPAQGGPGAPMPFATEAVVEAANEIARNAKKSRIGREGLKGADAALAVLHLAQTAEDPRLAGSALSKLPSLYSQREGVEQRTVDADYVAVVIRRLASDDPDILEGALIAADQGADVEPPDPALVAAMLKHVAPGQPPEARFLAMRGLASVKPLTDDIQKAFLSSLEDDDPAMVALTLSSMNVYWGRFTDRGPLITRLREMTSSEHAGVRAKALAALTNVDATKPHRDATTKIALEMLRDKHPLVRGEAVYALGSMRRIEDADKVLSMMNDDAEVKMEIEGWTGLDGSSAYKALLAPGAYTVTGSALRSLAELSRETDSTFEYRELVMHKTLEQPNYAAAVVAAKAWVKAHGGE